MQHWSFVYSVYSAFLKYTIVHIGWAEKSLCVCVFSEIAESAIITQGQSQLLCLKLLVQYNTLVKQINVLAVGWNYPFKVQRNCTGQIALCMNKVQRRQDFSTEIIDFVLFSRAWSCLSQGPARVKLWSVHCDWLKALCVVLLKRNIAS